MSRKFELKKPKRKRGKTQRYDINPKLEGIIEGKTQTLEKVKEKTEKLIEKHSFWTEKDDGTELWVIDINKIRKLISKLEDDEVKR